MQQLRATPQQGISRADMGWLQHVVRPLLCSPGAVGAPPAARTRGDAGLHSPARGRAYQGGCFAGAEGDGCELSESEKRVLARVWCEPMSWEV